MPFLVLNTMIYTVPGCQIRKKNFSNVWQNIKIYTSNIVDIVIVALATVANMTIVANYLDGLTVKNHVFKPTQKQSIAIIDVCFINLHYELMIDTTASFLTHDKISTHPQKKHFKNLHLTIPSITFLTILFSDTTFKIVSRTAGETTTSINAELIFTTGKTAVGKKVT